MRTFWQSQTCGVQTYFQPVPCCTSPSAEDRLSRVMVTEEPTGSSHSVPTITPPASPCLYLTVQQQVLMRTSSLFGSRNDEWSCLLVRKPCKSLNDQHGVTTADRVCMKCCAQTGVPHRTAQLCVPSISQQARLFMLLPFSLQCWIQQMAPELCRAWVCFLPGS